MRNFKQLKIWQKGFEIAVKSLKLAGDFQKKKKIWTYIASVKSIGINPF